MGDTDQLVAEQSGQPLVSFPPLHLLLQLLLLLLQQPLDELLAGPPLLLVEHPLLLCQLGTNSICPYVEETEPKPYFTVSWFFNEELIKTLQGPSHRKLIVWSPLVIISDIMKKRLNSLW